MDTPQAMDVETLRIVRAALSRLAADVGDLTARRARLSAAPVDERAHWALLAEQGLFGIGLPEAAGGLGGGAVELAEVASELAPGLLIEPWVESGVLAATLLRGAVPEHRALDPVLAGQTVVVPVGARLGASPSGAALRCRRTENGWQLSGRTAVEVGAAVADQWLIAARGDDGWHLFLSAALQTGRRDYRLMDGRSASDVDFFADTVLRDDCHVAAGAAVQAALEQAATRAAVVFCADAVGLMAKLVQTTRDYLNTRVQFGVPIGSFQALQHRLADMHIAALEARAMTRALAQAADAGEPGVRRLRSQAVSVLARTAPKVAHEAIQLHGGMGVTEELVVGHHNARLVVNNKLLQAWVPEVGPLDEEG